jgi:KipI family sensor histidine kinase inhibitor
MLRWTPYGPDAALIYFGVTVEAATFTRGRALMRAMEKHPPPGLREAVPSFTSVLLDFFPGLRPADLSPWLAALGDLHAAALTEAEPKTIPTRYDGPDLARVAEHAQLTIADVIECHHTPLYRVYALGFSPGFPYLGDLNPALHCPRLATPRPRVPTGSVAIGGEHTGIYPQATPGGWQLIGRTDIALFCPKKNTASAFFLQPGDRVKFIPTPA